MTKIGDTLWCFDTNRRVYTEPGGRAVYREHFVPSLIVGETKISWLCRPATWPNTEPVKVKKATLQSSNGAYSPSRWFTAEAMEADIYLEANRARIHLDILRCTNPKVLQAIDALLTGKANP